MEIKIFQIRISEEFQAADEKLICDFVRRCEILKIDSQLIKDEINYWSVLIFYNAIENYIEKPNYVYTTGNRRRFIKQYHKYNPKDNIAVSENLNLIEQSSEVQLMIYRKLKEWRDTRAESFNIPSYMMLKNFQLMSIARNLPGNLQDLETVNGIGRDEVERFGPEIMGILQNILE